MPRPQKFSPRFASVMRRVACQSPTRWGPNAGGARSVTPTTSGGGDALKTKRRLKHLVYMKELDERDIDRVIEMAWEDRTPFGAIEMQFGLPEKEVIELMRRELKRKSFERWRKRVSGRSTKHRKKRPKMQRFKSSRQKNISNNSIT